MGAEPVSVLESGVPAVGLTNLLLEFNDGRAVQVTHYRAAVTRPAMRLQVVAERGVATVELPDRVRWTDACGRYAHTVAAEQPLGEALLEQFHRTVTEKQAPQPSLDDAQRALGWLRAAARSRAEGKRVALG
jgi:hypothetical protein